MCYGNKWDNIKTLLFVPSFFTIVVLELCLSEKKTHKKKPSHLDSFYPMARPAMALFH